jgi:hypothetical protein
VSRKEIRATVARYGVDMEQVTTLMDGAIETLHTWIERTDQPPTPAELETLQDTLLRMYTRQRMLEGDTAALQRMLLNLLEQHQCMHKSFQLGWEARMTQLLAYVNGEEDAQLRKLIRDIQREADNPF